MIFDNLSEENKEILRKQLYEKFCSLSKGLPDLFEKVNAQKEFLHEQNLLLEKKKEVNFVWRTLQPWAANKELEKDLINLVKTASDSDISKAEYILKQTNEYIESDIKELEQIEKILNSLGVIIKRQENGCLCAEC